MNRTTRALLAAAVGATLLLAPTSALAAGKPAKPGPCVVNNGVSVVTTKAKGVTTITVTGTSGADVIDCSAARVRVVVHGMGVDSGSIGDTIYGGSKDDELHAEGTGSARFDYVTGNGGNDTIHAGGPNVTAFAMGDDFDPAASLAGDDTLIAGNGYVQFYGGAGNDQIDVSAATNAYVEGNVGNDSITGSPGQDSLLGGAGDDTLTDGGTGGEVFNCGDGTADVLNDLDGNGAGGWSGEAEDDTHVDCETVNVDDSAPCSFTPGTTGCAVLTNVAITDASSTATYIISGTVTFTPTCNALVPPCDYAYPNTVFTGSGTFSVSGSQSATGTWAVPAPPQDHPGANQGQFYDAGGDFTTCTAAVLQSIIFNLDLVTTGGTLGGGFMQVRADDTGTSSRVSALFQAGTLPVGTFQSPANSQAGFAFYC